MMFLMILISRVLISGIILLALKGEWWNPAVECKTIFSFQSESSPKKDISIYIWKTDFFLYLTTCVLKVLEG
jgi:hypothetical protein